MASILDNIPSDVEIEMTEDYKRAFLVAGCNPTCHCCGIKIPVDTKFKLAHMKTMNVSKMIDHRHKDYEQDEMLCADCTPKMLSSRRIELAEEHLNEYNNRHRGYTREHNNQVI